MVLPLWSMATIGFQYRRSEFSFTTSNSVMANQGITLVPSTDANRATMIRSSVWGNTVTLNMTAVPSGNYQVWLYVWEDNFTQTYSVSLEGSVVVSNFNSGTAGVWKNWDLIRSILRMAPSMYLLQVGRATFQVLKYGPWVHRQPINPGCRQCDQ